MLRFLLLDIRPLRLRIGGYQVITFFYKLGSLDALSDLLFIFEAPLAVKCFMQSGSEEVVSLGVFSTQIQQFYAVSFQVLHIRSFTTVTFIDPDNLMA